VSEQLDLIHAAFKVIRHVRRKKACACCDVIVQPPAASRPIERGIAGPGLLAHILVSKFADHQPLYRQSVIYARHGVDLDRSTMARWVGNCGALFNPLVQALRQYVLAPGKVHGDDTPVQVLAPGNGKTRTGRFWVYVRDDRNAGSSAPPAVWFAYTATRPAWRMQDASCMTCMSAEPRPPRPKHCAALASCTQSNPKSEANRRTSAWLYGSNRHDRYWRVCMPGCRSGC
jgi:transposase